MAERIRVLLAEDHPVTLAGVSAVVGTDERLELVGCATDGREALAAIAELEPDVALIDMRMGDFGGLDVLREVKRQGLPTRVLFLTAHMDSDTVYSAIAGGAQGYLSKESSAQEVRDAIARAARGEMVLSAETQTAIAMQIRERAMPAGPALSPREIEVLRLTAEGQSAVTAAVTLGVSTATVKTHLQRLYEKLGVNDRAAAVAEGMRRGLLS